MELKEGESMKEPVLFSPNSVDHKSSREDPNSSFIKIEKSSGSLKDICYVVENKEFWSFKNQLLKHSAYFSEVFSSLSTTKKHYRILLPKWVKEHPAKLFINYLETEQMPLTSMEVNQQLLWIADFYKSDLFIGKETQNSFVNLHIADLIHNEIKP